MDRSVTVHRSSRGGVLHLERGPYDDTLDRAKRIELRLGELGIPVNPSSRIARYRWLLEELFRIGRDGGTPSDSFRIRDLQQAVLEVGTIDGIVDALGDRPEWRAKLAEVVSGSTLPIEDSNSRARNTQFELEIAARLTGSGLNVSPQEPDIVLDLEGWKLGIAVKRVQSASKLRDRTGEARDQVRRARLLGLIAIDVSTLVFPTGGVEVTEAGDIPGYLRGQLDSFMMTTMREAGVFRTGLPLVGAVVHASVVATRVPGPQLIVARASRVASFLRRTDRRKAHLQRLSTMLANH